MKIVRPPEIARILATTDALGIHREAVRVPLAPARPGGARIEKGTLFVEVPLDEDFDTFLAALSDQIRALPGRDTLKPA